MLRYSSFFSPLPLSFVGPVVTPALGSSGGSEVRLPFPFPDRACITLRLEGGERGSAVLQFWQLLAHPRRPTHLFGIVFLCKKVSTCEFL